uniref:Alliinase C-terminal domain-containing protein n=1 Tax=Phaeomonas parva TaxID=124430 RepID=A0A7S1TUR2_9STRA|mmetsp:Transcript_18843/g.57263  ORF Transcript_18843/g.57263 Transcript_18843/m.57263 type:complete len:506 (+) Transcript_18843:180-1697(+)
MAPHGLGDDEDGVHLVPLTPAPPGAGKVVAAGPGRRNFIDVGVAAMSAALAAIALIVACVALARGGSNGASCSSSGVATLEAGLPYARCSDQGIWDTMSGQCLCFDCFRGATCEHEVPLDECTIDATGGNPRIFEDYWVRHPEASVNIVPSEHIGYGEKLGCDKLALDLGSYRVPEAVALTTRCDLLAEALRRLHFSIGNADARDWHIIPAVGSTHLIMGAMMAYRSAIESNATVKVVSEPPYYDGYSQAAQFIAPMARLEWAGIVENSGELDGEEHVIEYVTSPNNPDGAMRDKRFPQSSVIFDYAYQWPHYTPVSSDLLDQVPEGGVALFTMSKVTGHAGTRLGWALTKDTELALQIYNYLSIHGAIPRESQMRAFTILRHMEDTNYEILREARAEMRRRWDVVDEIFGGSACYHLNARGDPIVDAWTGENAAATPAYLWLHCENRDADNTCYDHLQGFGLRTKKAEDYGAAPGTYVRIELLMRAGTFDLMAEKLREVEASGC